MCVCLLGTNVVEVFFFSIHSDLCLILTYLFTPAEAMNSEALQGDPSLRNNDADDIQDMLYDVYEKANEVSFLAFYLFSLRCSSESLIKKDQENWMV
jgi:hypothetical protein